MRYYSTKRSSAFADLKEAVIRGLAPDGGLYMPERIPVMPQAFFDAIGSLSFREIAFQVADPFFGEDIPEPVLREIVYDTLSFDAPLVPVAGSIFALELFHGPTLAFKDFGARFMARLLNYFIRNSGKEARVLVATSGDTGSAVANGFLHVDGVRVCVLYPRGRVSELQEKQFATLGGNIAAVAVDGTFDDCQALVKGAFSDPELNAELLLTSANSINIARLLPQMFYYFHAYAQLKRIGKADEMVLAVPSGNFGNLAAAVLAKKMGLPVKRFVAANNRNDVFCEYLRTGKFRPRPSVATVANAMDVGNPSNFDRILEMYGSCEAMRREIEAFGYDDGEIGRTVKRVYGREGYLLDPHGACGYRALEESLRPGECGVFSETAHPAKFRDRIEKMVGARVPLPERLARFAEKEVGAFRLPPDPELLKRFLLENEGKFVKRYNY